MDVKPDPAQTSAAPLAPGGGQEHRRPAKVNYGRPFETPVRPAFIPLPPGAVEPQGWLRDWCLTARNGYTGHMDEYDVAFRQAWAADWRPVGEALRLWDKGAWPCEGGGYWFDGLVQLAYALHDDLLLSKAKARLDAVVDNMHENSILFVWWLDRHNPAHMSENEAGCLDWFPQWASGFLGRTLAAYYAASRDERALHALQMAYDGDPAWLRRRFAQSNMYPAFETYTWTGNPAIKAALTELFEKRVNKNMPGQPVEIGMPFSIAMPDEKTPWYEQAGNYMCNDGGWISIKSVHGVHFNDLVSPWALGYLWTGDPQYLAAVTRYYDMVERDGMQPYGVMVADEFGGPTGASRGTETCNVSAYMWSQIQLLRISGQAALADRVERAFFNAAPAAVTRDFTGHVYTQVPNRVRPAGGGRDYRRTHWPLCCTASVNRFLPYYVVHMWMATYDNGLAATTYGPCHVSALVADHVPVELVCRTDYPFGEVIDIGVKLARRVRFPLSFRIPGWCKDARVAVNGSAVPTALDANGFVRIEREWGPEDTVHLHFPMSPHVTIGHDANAGGAPFGTVTYGPLLFALPVAELDDANTPDPAAKWKYALDAPGEAPGSDIVVERLPMPARWDWPLASPLKLQAHGLIFAWDGEALPAQPVGANGGQRDRLDLVPYGCTTFRVSMLPVTERTLRAVTNQ